jgi:asparagine synthase (glutamine-hydrolysing)
MVRETPSGTVVLTYSGEVYNFVELRRDLIQRGYRFRTNSDTEVVLISYLEWGESFAERLNGMFALAIWDEREAKLVMIRDRLGIKPLYYYPTPDGVLFGSEPKAILANPIVERGVDADGLRGLVASSASAQGWCLWKGVREVEPGTVVALETSGIRKHTYWKLSTVEHVDNRSETLKHVRELMSDIVTRQLVADVPRCVLLSGGLDSSTITALAASRLADLDEELRTFSVDFYGYEEHFTPTEGCITPDSPFINDVVEQVGSLHRDVMLDAHALADPCVRRSVIAARDSPSVWGDRDASLYLMFEAIRSESTVALSGESADEVFGGYPWLHDEEALKSNTFPSIAFARSRWGHGSHLAWLRLDVRDLVDLDRYVAEQYTSALSKVEHLPAEG